MRVDTELVRDQLVSSILGAARVRFAELPAAARAAIEAEFEDPVAVDVAAVGYLSRVAETERFDAARKAMPWLASRLAAGGATPGEDPRAISRELAEIEPAGRPDPASDAPSWRVPGPGGHVRHYVALAAIQGHASGGEAKRIALKRAWLFGFFLRCCGEIAPQPRDAAASAD